MAQIPEVEALYLGDGTTRTYGFGFPYLTQGEVFVTVDGVAVSFDFLSAATVELTVAPPTGAEIRIYRSTAAETLRHVFDGGVPFLPRYVDDNNRQLLYAAQEAIATTADDAAEALATANAAIDKAEATEALVEEALTDSALQLRTQLANNIDPALGAALIGYKLRPLAARLAHVAYATDNGATGTGSDDTVALQAVINSGAKLIIWPAGNYRVTRLTPRSNQVWVGVQRDAVRVYWALSNRTVSGYSMIQSDGDISGFHIRSMTFVGNRQFQTTMSLDAQDMGCVHLRGGSVIDFSFTDCLVRDFGTLNSGPGNAGHGILIGSRNGTGKKIRNIRIHSNEFRDISNVPGVYVNGESTFNNEMLNIQVEDNDFYVDITTAVQNCVYILGDASNIGRSVKVRDNRTHISKPIDCNIELNWVADYHVEDNHVYATGTGTCTPVLIRDGTDDGSVCRNHARNSGTGAANAAGVSIVAFDGAGGLQRRVVVQGNHLYNWGLGGSGAAFNFSAGSTSILATGNMVSGNSSSEMVDSAFILGNGVSNVIIRDNDIRLVRYPLRLAGSCVNCDFSDNTLTACGDGVSSLLISNGGGSSVSYLTIERNKLRSVIAGTIYLVGVVSTVNTGNRCALNELPPGVSAVNPSYLGSQATITQLKTGRGDLLMGNQYTFAQGSLAMADGQGFTIGNNLDAQGPLGVPGDIVMVSFVGNPLGALIYGYVQANNQVRVRVQNETGASITIPAGDWRVVIITT